MLLGQLIDSIIDLGLPFLVIPILCDVSRSTPQPSTTSHIRTTFNLMQCFMLEAHGSPCGMLSGAFGHAALHLSGIAILISGIHD